MAMDVIATGGVSGIKQEVETGGYALVNTPADSLLSGFVRAIHENDPGRVTGAANLRCGEVSEDFRQRAELDTLLDTYNFNDTVQNTAKHLYRNTTMTITWAGGALNTNASGITTINTGVLFQTYQYFPIYGAAQTYAFFKLKFSGTFGVTNTTADVGFLGIAAATTPYAPTDGVYFRVNSTGVFGVMNVNGAETTTSPFVDPNTDLAWVPTIGTEYDCLIYVGENAISFWVDFRDTWGYTTVARLLTPTGDGRPARSGALQFGVRHAIGGSAASAVMGLQMAGYTVMQGGYNFSRDIATQMAMMGASGSQGQSGHASLGSTALYTNSLAPGAGVALTNTTAAAGSGLGGQFSTQPTLAANTDGILSSYQNPVPTNLITGRQLVLDRVRIQGMVTTALTGGPVLYAVSLAWGHTAVSLATAEGATTKAPRRKALGFLTFVVTSPVGTASTVIDTELTDVVLNPGEFIQVVVKNVGTVTSAGVITFLISHESHWA